MSTAGSLGSGLVSSRVSRWLGSSSEPFLVPLPGAVAPSCDTGAGLSLSGCFPACQASRVKSCRDFPDGCLAPASSPSGWASSWSTKPGRHIALASALPPQFRAPAPASRPGAGWLPVVLRPPCLGDAGWVARERGCKCRRRAGTESRRGWEARGETCHLFTGRLGWPDWLGKSGPGGQHRRRSFAASAGGRAGRIRAGGDRHLPVLEPRERGPLEPGRRARAARGWELGRQSQAGMASVSWALPPTVQDGTGHTGMLGLGKRLDLRPNSRCPWKTPSPPRATRSSAPGVRTQF